jgi:hypothetical protein
VSGADGIVIRKAEARPEALLVRCKRLELLQQDIDSGNGALLAVLHSPSNRVQASELDVDVESLAACRRAREIRRHPRPSAATTSSFQPATIPV